MTIPWFKHWMYRLPLIRGVLACLIKLKNRCAELLVRVVTLSQTEVSQTRPDGDASVMQVASFLDSLLSPDAAKVWDEFHRQLSLKYNEFSERLGLYLQGNDLIHMLSLLLVIVFRNGFKDYSTRIRLFDVAESMGGHVLPVHYYSPIPDTSQIPANLNLRLWDNVIEFNPSLQLELVAKLSKWAIEMSDTPPENDPQHPYDFYWNNPAFGPMDAIVYYSMIREFKPRRILEIGSGYSTLVAAKAVQKNGISRLECIEPYPPVFLSAGFPGLSHLMAVPVQDVPLEKFEQLEENDILFVDGTHVSKFNSDVNRIVFDILPRLQSGVLVHFHDIFLPYDYPLDWVKEKKLFWNEQYVLLAFLMYNNRWQVLLSNYYLGSDYRNSLQQAFPFSPVWGGASFWMRKL